MITASPTHSNRSHGSNGSGGHDSHGGSPADWNLPYRGTIGMVCLIVAESAIFTIFVVAYLFYLGKSLGGPTPKEVLSLPILASVCLLSSSLTIELAIKALRRGNTRAFGAFWLTTIALGAAFLVATAFEWAHLITVDRLTITTNLFGTTFYSLVGLHASHVVIGLLMLLAVMAFALLGSLRPAHVRRVEVLGMYWHFVDAIWVVVFTVVYLIGR